MRDSVSALFPAPALCDNVPVSHACSQCRSNMHDVSLARLHPVHPFSTPLSYFDLSFLFVGCYLLQPKGGYSHSIPLPLLPRWLASAGSDHVRKEFCVEGDLHFGHVCALLFAWRSLTFFSEPKVPVETKGGEYLLTPSVLESAASPEENR